VNGDLSSIEQVVRFIGLWGCELLHQAIGDVIFTCIASSRY
jgi:hypothetical protein